MDTEIEQYFQGRNGCHNCNNHIRLYTIEEHKIHLTYFSYCRAKSQSIPPSCNDWIKISTLNQTTNEFVEKVNCQKTSRQKTSRQKTKKPSSAEGDF